MPMHLSPTSFLRRNIYTRTTRRARNVDFDSPPRQGCCTLLNTNHQLKNLCFGDLSFIAEADTATKNPALPLANQTGPPSRDYKFMRE